MTKPEISRVAPFFIVADCPAALAFYRDRLGFDITFQGPTEDDIFFGIVCRGGAMIMLKDIGVDPVPNYTRDIQKGIARWDAYFNVPDPDALAAEFASRDVEFSSRSRIMMTDCAGSRSKTRTATFYFSVVRGKAGVPERIETGGVLNEIRVSRRHPGNTCR
jgi:catechol 2,3-dioxygenase-like lactoylglutathione lyase family enzyme